ncbi:MAG: hypothetical protein JNN15_20420 [Blastocatellia bacterium]|nr:hypothetical protein [Blastocatellia bacterium]
MDQDIFSQTEQLKKYDPRNAAKAILTEEDMKAFDIFYREFLGKKPEESVSFLKVASVLTREDLREFVHQVVAKRSEFETMLEKIADRDLLLSFPSTTKNVYELIFDYSQIKTKKEDVANKWLTQQAKDFLDCTQMFRSELDSLLATLPSMLPRDCDMLRAHIDSGLTMEGCDFLLLILADKPFLILLDSQAPSEVLTLKVELFLKENLAEKYEEQMIEFFVAGGGFLSVKEGRILIGGRSDYADPKIETLESPTLVGFLGLFYNHKFDLTKTILEREVSAIVEPITTPELFNGAL